MLLLSRPIAIVAVPRCVLPLPDRVMRMRRGSPFSLKTSLPVFFVCHINTYVKQICIYLKYWIGVGMGVISIPYANKPSQT